MSNRSLFGWLQADLQISTLPGSAQLVMSSSVPWSSTCTTPYSSVWGTGQCALDLDFWIEVAVHRHTPPNPPQSKLSLTSMQDLSTTCTSSTRPFWRSLSWLSCMDLAFQLCFPLRVPQWSSSTLSRKRCFSTRTEYRQCTTNVSLKTCSDICNLHLYFSVSSATGWSQTNNCSWMII